MNCPASAKLLACEQWHRLLLCLRNLQSLKFAFIYSYRPPLSRLVLLRKLLCQPTNVPDTIDTITSATATTCTSITQSTISPLSWTPLSPLPPVLSPLPPVLSPLLSPSHTRSPCSWRSAPRSLFPQSQPDGHSQIIWWLQHVAELQKQMMERFDTLISLLSGTSEVASPPVEPSRCSKKGHHPVHSVQPWMNRPHQRRTHERKLSFYCGRGPLPKKILLCSLCGISFCRMN